MCVNGEEEVETHHEHELRCQPGEEEKRARDRTLRFGR
jgi:hypothetical protein